MPSKAQAIASDLATLFPSPTKVNVSPSSRPICLRSVYRSASAWHGWLKSLRALITGTLDDAANCLIVACDLERHAMQSTYSLSTRLKSSILSRELANPVSSPRNSPDPPRCTIAVWKLTRVRRLCFSKTSARTRPGKSASRTPAAYFVSRSWEIAKTPSISCGVKSSTTNK